MGLALIAGALIPLQASSNGTLGRELGHPLWAALTSLINRFRWTLHNSSSI
ncbi:DMT family transporter [Pseudomonas sp. 09C 129]|uniref:DMT family transporter n=1 Tax=Pseudomonas sp. 09C 129 TaxID=2054915 RepID=UPI001C477392|nr:DMT family transporter [Pseudomonas sp. 09C 129]